MAATPHRHYLSYTDVDEIAQDVAERIFTTPKGEAAEVLLQNAERLTLGAWTQGLLAEHLKEVLRKVTVSSNAPKVQKNSYKKRTDSNVVTIGD